MWNKKTHLIYPPNSNIWWLKRYAGASCALQRGNTSIFDIYITGRDILNRSRIGHGTWSPDDPTRLISIDSNPCIELGPIGSFADNGTSYPSVIKFEERYFMYFTGWNIGKTVPFYNNVGLAISKTPQGPFEYLSYAPILNLCHEEPFGSGSSFCRYNSKEKVFELFYTSFQKWIKSKDKISHTYCIKKTTSIDGCNWVRPGVFIIKNTSKEDAIISRPSLMSDSEIFYCKRGENNKYKIYRSQKMENGKWINDKSPCIASGFNNEWDGHEQCYPFVFSYKSKDYMFYCGNNYGKDGLGIVTR